MATRTLVEVGVGALDLEDRPFARSASAIGVDLDLAALLKGGTRPSIAADGVRLPLRAGSIDCVVAKNVFGDVGLGHDFQGVTGFDPPDYAAHGRALPDAGRLADLQQLRARIRAMTDAVEATRTSLLLEADRVLRPAGSI